MNTLPEIYKRMGEIEAIEEPTSAENEEWNVLFDKMEAIFREQDGE